MPCSGDRSNDDHAVRDGSRVALVLLLLRPEPTGPTLKPRAIYGRPVE